MDLESFVAFEVFFCCHGTMSVNETPVLASLTMDRDTPLGNSQDATGRRALHVKNLAQLVVQPYTAGTVDYPDDTTEVYKFRTGSRTGPVVQTVTLYYVDSTKADLAAWESTTP